MRATERIAQRTIETYAACWIYFAVQMIRTCIFGLRCQLAALARADPNHDLLADLAPTIPRTL
jgi:hypothetical protein